MKKKLQSALSLCIALCLVLGILPTAALATSGGNTITVSAATRSALESAIRNATAGDTIEFAEELYEAATDGIIQIAITSQITIDKSLSIVGRVGEQGQPLVKLNAATTGIFAINVPDAITVSLRGLELTGGSASYAGGAIFANTPVTLDIDRCAFVGNTASISINSAAGGAIYLLSDLSTLRVVNSSFRGNGLTGESGDELRGGAIYTNGSCTILNSTFYANYLTGGGTMAGSAVYAPFGATLSHCTLLGNTGAESMGGGPRAPSVQNSIISCNSASTSYGESNYHLYTADDLSLLFGQSTYEALADQFSYHIAPRITAQTYPRDTFGEELAGKSIVGRSVSSGVALATDAMGHPRGIRVTKGAAESFRWVTDTGIGEATINGVTLANAIAGAPDYGVVAFADDLYTVDEDGVSHSFEVAVPAQITINKSLSILGRVGEQGQPLVRLTTPNFIRFFDITTGATAVSLRGLELTGGTTADAGGAIRSRAVSVTLDIGSCAFVSNTAAAAMSTATGGAIGLLSDLSTLRVVNSSFRGNSLTGETEKTLQGGAIFTNGSCTILNSTFYANSLLRGGTMAGSAVYAPLGATLYHCTLLGNTGAESIESAGTLDVKNSIISFNAARVNYGETNYYLSLTENADDVTRLFNEQDYADLAILFSHGHIYPRVTEETRYLEHRTEVIIGEAITGVDDDILAVLATDPYGNPRGPQVTRGAAESYRWVTTTAETVLDQEDLRPYEKEGTMTDAIATLPDHGIIGFAEELFTAAQAAGQTQVVIEYDGKKSAGVVANVEGRVNEAGQPLVKLIGDGTASALYMNVGEDIRITGLELTGYNGAIVSGTNRTIIRNCIFRDNTGRAVSAGDVTITDCGFYDNAGGAVSAGGASYITGCVFSGNTAEGQGGAIAMSDFMGSIANCTFYGNRAVGDSGCQGGALYAIAGGQGNVTNCTFYQNSVDTHGDSRGSAIYLTSSSSNMGVVYCTFVDNTGAEDVYFGENILVKNNLIECDTLPVDQGANRYFTVEQRAEYMGSDTPPLVKGHLLPTDMLLNTASQLTGGETQRIEAWERSSDYRFNFIERDALGNGRLDNAVTPGAVNEIVDYEEPLPPSSGGSGSRPTPQPVSPYEDVFPEDWFFEDVLKARELGLMLGVSDTRFDPTGTASRAMVITALWRLAGSPQVNYIMPFDDVEEETWYTEAVRWAASIGLALGSGEKFQPTLPVTREQLGCFLYRYEQIIHEGGFVGLWAFPLDFDDAEEVSDWAYEAMCWLVMNQVIQGEDGSILPADTANRAEIAAMLVRFVNLR